MPDFSIKDSLGNPVDIAQVNWTSASSLGNYVKSQALHLIVVPDFIARKDKTLTEAAPKPLTFHLSVKHDFQLGNTKPEIDITPGAEVRLTVDATQGDDLFDDDSFHVPSAVPPGTAYVGLTLTGSLDLGVSGSSGDLTFGIDRSSRITFQFLKAFPTGSNETTLGSAAAAAWSDFVIPAQVSDLSHLGLNDVCCVSGQGCLKISGSVTFTLPVNPLASLNLPLGTGTVAIRDGVLAGLSASLSLTGGYQIRLERLAESSIRLSFLSQRGAELVTDLTASAGVSVALGTTDLLAKLLGNIATGAVDKTLLDGLTPDEIDSFTDAVKSGLDHSLRAAIDLALSTKRDNEAAFQYEIQPALFNAQSTQAVAAALKGDLSLLTALEENAATDGTLAPGIKLLNSVFSTARTQGASLKINLLGIVNLISVAKLISSCEFLFEPATGDLTIKETAQSEKISAITDPFKRQEALRKALFYSVLATTTYVIGKAVVIPDLRIDSVHFAVNQNTNQQTLADYINWLVALDLMSPDEQAQTLNLFSSGGPSTCIVRTRLDNALCEALFFNAQGNPRPAADYLELGRKSLRALLDPGNSDIDRARCQFLDNPTTWTQAVDLGPSPQLASLIPLSSADPKFNVVMADVTGDLYDIVWWANGMQKASQALQKVRTFLAGRDPATLANDPAFSDQRDGLQKTMRNLVASSQLRFHEPWGIVCLFRAAGSRGASGKLTAGKLVIQKDGAIPPAAKAVP
jgi:hypothetical protein